MSTRYMSSIMMMMIVLVMAAAAMAEAAPFGGRWKLLQKSVGISAMHMQLLYNDRVIMLDRTNFGESQIKLPNGKCRNNDLAINPDCTAHSVEYNLQTDTFRPLMILTNTWCSSGAVNGDGTLVQTGGTDEGEKVVRLFKPCSSNTCDWNELGNLLNVPRWYSSDHILPDGEIIIVGGRDQFSYEFYPKNTGLHDLPFLQQTKDQGGGNYNNLYPFVFLAPDGNLFIFANTQSILLNYKTNTVVRTFPNIPGGQPRNYPSSGSAVLLPLTNINSKTVQAEVLVCGGAPAGSFQQANNGNFQTALQDCGRLRFTDPKPKWFMEIMPIPRVMGDMLIEPNGDVLIINGCKRGTASWGLCRDDVRTPVLYKTYKNHGKRFEVQTGTNIPRVYHSTAIVTRTGEILVAGSNNNPGYDFNPNILYPTQLSVEKFQPWYVFSKQRPQIQQPKSSHLKLKYNQVISIVFSVPGGAAVDLRAVKVTIYLPPFNTHTFSQSQRLLELPLVRKPIAVSKKNYQVTARMPNSEVIAPPLNYMMFVVHKEAPSVGKWIKITR